MHFKLLVQLAALKAGALFLVMAAGAANAASLTEQQVDRLLEVVNTNEGESWISIHPTEPYVLFGRHDNSFSNHRVYVTRLEGDEWSLPSLAPFAAGLEARAARFTPDGGGVFFSANQPGEDGAENWNVWRVSYAGSNRWGEAAPLPAPINSAAPDFHPSATNGTAVYFGSRRAGGAGNADMYRAHASDGGWQITAVAGLNTAASEPDPFVSPDESYMIFARTNAPGGYGGDDLYFSARTVDGWSSARNLGPQVNTAEYEYGAFVTADGKTLFFTTYRDGQADIVRVPFKPILDGN